MKFIEILLVKFGILADEKTNKIIDDIEFEIEKREVKIIDEIRKENVNKMNNKAYKWINIDTGKFLFTMERDIEKCPKCNMSFEDLHSNRYKDLEVTSQNDKFEDISICIKMVYCSKCCELYIRDDY